MVGVFCGVSPVFVAVPVVSDKYQADSCTGVFSIKQPINGGFFSAD